MPNLPTIWDSANNGANNGSNNGANNGVNDGANDSVNTSHQIRIKITFTRTAALTAHPITTEPMITKSGR